MSSKSMVLVTTVTLTTLYAFALDVAKSYKLLSMYIRFLCMCLELYTAEYLCRVVCCTITSHTASWKGVKDHQLLKV